MNIKREINRISKNKFTTAANECSIYFESRDSKLETVSSNFKCKIAIVDENRRFCYSECCVVKLLQKTYSSVARACNSCRFLGNYLKKEKAVYYITEVQIYVFF